MMRGISIFFMMTILVVGAAFALLNAQDVTINYFLGQQTMPLAFVLALVFVLGILLGVGLMSLKLIGLRWANKRLQRKIDKQK